MRILFAWTGVASYMADCWRSLQQSNGVELKVVVEAADSGKAFAAEKTLAGLDYVLVEKDDAGERWKDVLRGGWRPDVVFAGGWRSSTTRKVVAALPDVPKVFCLDMPWRWLPRCLAARFALRGFMRNFAAVFVPGRLSAKYARWLGFPKRLVFDCLYAVDQSRLRSAVAAIGTEGRRGFLFVGRFSPEKRVDLVEAAYARYRQIGGTWGIDYYGQGGKFAQAEEMSAVYASHACLLLASSFDPWPLVMLEAKSAGLEVIASSRCGNCDELGAVKVPYGDVEAMAKAMLDVERGAGRGNCSVDVAKYDCPEWARRVQRICQEVRKGKFFCPGLNDVDNGMAVVARLLSEDVQFGCAYMVHGAWLPAGWLQCLKLLLAGRGYVRMPHGSYSPVYLEESGRLKKRIARPVERWLLRHAEKVIATCEAERRWIEAYEPKARVEVVDLRKYNWGGKHWENGQACFPMPGNRPVHVLYMGRRHPLKGLQYLEEAVKQSNSELGGNSKRWNLGFLPFELRVETDARGDEKESAFDWCDVLCLPTLSENFGIVVAEALARGKPVITTDGAPAWADAPRTDADGKTRLVYIEGYRDATPVVRVQMLKQALSKVCLEVCPDFRHVWPTEIWYNTGHET